MFDNYTDIPIVDFSIKDTDTALMLAQQKIVEYALKNSSKLKSIHLARGSEQER